MSNYLLAVGKTSHIEKISKVFEKSNNYNSEISVKKVSDDFSILSISKDEFLRTDSESVFFFKGWFQDHETKSIVLGGNGFQKWKKDTEKGPSTTGKEFEGAYVSMNFQHGKLCVRNDVFSYLPVIYFSNKELFVCSDSMYIISKIRKSLGMPCKLNKNVMHSRAWTHGLACVVMSNETQICGVKLLSPGKSIEMKIKTGLFSSKTYLQAKNYIKTSNLKKTFDVEFESYEQAIRDATTKLAQSTMSLLHLDDVLIKFGLSGGLDSRVILAAILQSPDFCEKIAITTNTHQSRKGDFDVVEKLSTKFKFTFNDDEKIKLHKKKYSLKTEKVGDRFSLWVLSSMGIYDMMYLHDSYWPIPHIIDMGGHGAESIKGTFTQMKFEDYIKPKKVSNKAKFSRKGLKYVQEAKEANIVHDAIRSELSSALASNGVDLDDYASIQWHYLSYKSPIANGRYLDRSSIGIRPFIQHSLFALSISKINPFKHAKRGEPTMIHDMLILLSPELAAIDFENKKSNISEEYIQSRLESLGGRLQFSESQPYAIYGSIAEMRNGPSSVFLDIVEHDFKPNDDDMKSILNALERAWDKITDKKVKSAYQNAYDTAKERLNDSEYYLPSAGTPAAKIISLSVLNDK